MPLYEYRYRLCGNISEIPIYDHKTAANLHCASCGSKELDKLLAVPGIIRNEIRAKGVSLLRL